MPKIKLEALKKAFTESIVPDDVIMAILSVMKENKIPKDPAIIHQAIYTLKSQPGREILKEFSFDESALTPFSELLDQVLFRLETSRILGTLNPAYENYELKKEYLTSAYEKFPQPSQKLIDEISEQFERLIN